MQREACGEHDLALTEGADGRPLMHRADCPDARREAALGKPVMTLFSIEGPLPDDVPRHSCLEGRLW
jgi:hypothetical protein